MAFLLLSISATAQTSKLGIILTNKDSLQNYSLPNTAPLYHEGILDILGVQWWYDYLPEVPPTTAFSRSRDHKLFGWWSLSATKADTTITAKAAAAKAAYGHQGPVYWFLANEPNNASQAKKLPKDYAPLFKKYRDAILAGDSTARIIGPALVWWDSAHYFSDYAGIVNWFHNAGHLYGKEWYQAFRNEYHTLYGVYPQLDGFNFHLYDFADFYNRTGIKIPNIMDELHDLLSDLQGWTETASKPVWITELGIPSFNGVSLTDAQRVHFMRAVLDSVTAVSQVERVFWFHAHPDVASPDWSPQTDLFHNNGRMSLLGQQFASLAQYWSTQALCDSQPGLTNLSHLVVAHSGDTAWAVTRQGKVGIGTTCPAQQLDVYGNIALSGVTLHTSDRRFKRDIQPITDATTLVAGLRGVRYRWRQEAYPERQFPTGPQYGLVAQEVEKVLPEIVHRNAADERSVNYEALIPLLLEAIKELQQEQVQLRAEIDQLKQNLTSPARGSGREAPEQEASLTRCDGFRGSEEGKRVIRHMPSYKRVHDTKPK